MIQSVFQKTAKWWSHTLLLRSLRCSDPQRTVTGNSSSGSQWCPGYIFPVHNLGPWWVRISIGEPFLWLTSISPRSLLPCMPSSSHAPIFLESPSPGLTCPRLCALKAQHHTDLWWILVLCFQAMHVLKTSTLWDSIHFLGDSSLEIQKISSDVKGTDSFGETGSCDIFLISPCRWWCSHPETFICLQKTYIIESHVELRDKLTKQRYFFHLQNTSTFASLGENRARLVSWKN